MRVWWLGVAALGAGILAPGAFRFYLAAGVPVALFAWFVLSRQTRGGQLAAWWAVVIGAVAALLASALLVYEPIPRTVTMLLVTFGIPVLQGLGAWLGEPGASGKTFVAAAGGAYVGQILYWRWLQLCLGLSVDGALDSLSRFVLLLWLVVFAPMAVSGALGAGLGARRPA